MTDFESKLRASLRDHADEAPTAAGLADGARRRLRRRRTAIATAALAAAVAVGAPFVLLDRDPTSTGVATDPTSPPTATAESETRTESWHDVTFEVPSDWGYGGVTAWCTEGKGIEEARPVVTRPDTMVPMILCDPGSGYGVTVGSAASFDPAYASGHVWQYQAEGTDEASFPDDAWLGIWYERDVAITVATPDRATTEQVVDSIRTRYGEDANGCPALQGNAEATHSGLAEALSLCHYDGQGRLTASRRLVGEDARRARDVLFSAPLRTTDVDCSDPGPLPGTAIMDGTSGYAGEVVTEATCEGANGIFFTGVVRTVTDDVLREIDLTRLP